MGTMDIRLCSILPDSLDLDNLRLLHQIAPLDVESMSNNLWKGESSELIGTIA